MAATDRTGGWPPLSRRADELEQRGLRRSRCDADGRRAGAPQWFCNLFGEAKLNGLECAFEPALARQSDISLGAPARKMQHAIEGGCQGGGGYERKVRLGNGAVDDNGFHLEAAIPKRAGEVAGPVLTGEIKQRRSRAVARDKSCHGADVAVH